MENYQKFTAAHIYPRGGVSVDHDRGRQAFMKAVTWLNFDAN